MAAKLQAPSSLHLTGGSMARLSVRGAQGQAAGAGGDRHHREAVGDDIDVEKGHDSAASRRPRPARQVSHQNLVNNVMTIKETFFGLIYIHAKRFSVESTRRSLLFGEPRPSSEEFESTFGFRPAQWLLTWNFNLGAELMITHDCQN
ncbi:hypothetical protein MMC30_008563 [Trapelia coarctata]|nr:hypothetical protein [Trapelia coarctata]